MNFALVNGKSVLREVPIPSEVDAVFTTDDGAVHLWADILADDKYRLQLNLRHLIIVPTEFDPVTEMLGPPVYVVEPSSVSKSFPKVPRRMDDSVRAQALAAVAGWRRARKSDPIQHDGEWIDSSQMLSSELADELLVAMACKLQDAPYKATLPAVQLDRDVTFNKSEDILDLLVQWQSRRSEIDESASVCRDAIAKAK